MTPRGPHTTTYNGDCFMSGSDKIASFPDVRALYSSGHLEPLVHRTSDIQVQIQPYTKELHLSLLENKHRVIRL